MFKIIFFSGLTELETEPFGTLLCTIEFWDRSINFKDRPPTLNKSECDKSETLIRIFKIK